MKTIKIIRNETPFFDKVATLFFDENGVHKALTIQTVANKSDRNEAVIWERTIWGTKEGVRKQIADEIRKCRAAKYRLSRI